MAKDLSRSHPERERTSRVARFRHCARSQGPRLPGRSTAPGRRLCERPRSRRETRRDPDRRRSRETRGQPRPRASRSRGEGQGRLARNAIEVSRGVHLPPGRTKLRARGRASLRLASGTLPRGARTGRTRSSSDSSGSSGRSPTPTCGIRLRWPSPSATGAGVATSPADPGERRNLAVSRAQGPRVGRVPGLRRDANPLPRRCSPTFRHSSTVRKSRRTSCGGPGPISRRSSRNPSSSSTCPNRCASCCRSVSSRDAPGPSILASRTTRRRRRPSGTATTLPSWARGRRTSRTGRASAPSG